MTIIQKGELMDDLISRQVAIDALEKVAALFPWKVPGNRDSYDRYNEAWNDAIGRAEIEIEELPSVQPEQRWIPCGKCIHADGRHRRCKILDRSINEDYFCYWAERI